MNMHVTDWAAHYKAVRRRIAGGALTRDVEPSPASVAAIEQPRIEPAPPVGPSYIGPVVYQFSFNYLRSLQRKARRCRPGHPLDKRVYPKAIGPHQLVTVRKPGRDILRIASDQPVVTGKRMSGAEILAEVCAQYDVSKVHLLSHRREERYATPRLVVYYRLYTETPMSLTQIGRMMNRDHTTIQRGIRSYEAQIEGREHPLKAKARAAACVEG